MNLSNVCARPLADWIGLIGDVYASGKPVMLLLDFDGTLAPIVPVPDLAVLPPRTEGVMRSLLSLGGIRIGIISGRTLDDVRKRVGVDGILYAGSGGLELELEGQRKSYPVLGAISNTMGGIRRRLSTIVAPFSGAWVEEKPGCLAIHYRALGNMDAAELLVRVNEVLSLLPEIRFRNVSKAIEVTPANGWDKGTAVEAMLRFYSAGNESVHFPVYFGDAANDLEGMAATLKAGGVAVGIGTDAPAIANHNVTDTDNLYCQLHQMLEVLDGLRDVHAQAREKRGRSPMEFHGEKSILILDSDAHHAQRLAASMKECGWKVESRCIRFPGVSLDLEALRIGNFSHLLVDYMLPGFLASKIMAWVKAKHPGVRAIGMIESSRIKSDRPIRNKVPNPVLPKPVCPNALAGILDSTREKAEVERDERLVAPC